MVILGNCKIGKGLFLDRPSFVFTRLAFYLQEREKKKTCSTPTKLDPSIFLLNGESTKFLPKSYKETKFTIAT